jgi:hypothetical protein
MLETLPQKAIFGNGLCEIGNECGRKTTYQVTIDTEGGKTSSKDIYHFYRILHEYHAFLF